MGCSGDLSVLSGSRGDGGEGTYVSRQKERVRIRDGGVREAALQAVLTTWTWTCPCAPEYSGDIDTASHGWGRRPDPPERLSQELSET